MPDWEKVLDWEFEKIPPTPWENQTVLNHLDRNQKPPGLWTSLGKDVCLCAFVCIMPHIGKAHICIGFTLKLFVCTGFNQFCFDMTVAPLHTQIFLIYTFRFRFFARLRLRLSIVFKKLLQSLIVVKNPASTSELRFRLTALWSVACSISTWVTDSLMYLNSRGEIKRRDTFDQGDII